MPILQRLLASIIAMVLAAGVTATFIVEDSSGTDDSVASDGTPSTVDTVPEGSDDGDATPDSTSTSSTTSGDTSSSAPPTTAAATTTTAPPSTQAPTTTQRPRPGVTPTTPGTYTYDVTGTVDGEDVNATSTLTVGKPDSEGRQTQTEEGEGGRTTTVYRYTNEGTYLESIKMEADGQPSVTLTATSPFLIIPADAQSGTETEGKLQGNGLTADVTFTVLDLNADTSTGKADTKISGTAYGIARVDGTMTSTIAARSSDQLPLDIKAKSDVTAGGQRSTSDTHSKLRQ